MWRRYKSELKRERSEHESEHGQSQTDNWSAGVGC
ncbi:hypothetical protein GGR45_002616 [Sphingomonas zeae]|nr:hypothetical protein [Sphingomonas zeae]